MSANDDISLADNIQGLLNFAHVARIQSVTQSQLLSHSVHPAE
ncbi:hypothetical protein VQ7734_04162 [Vibrio quintilis]|uniref:Uncharacterized protein n=1 Tax=Vibrio quintilis TaxID=1117707 RepID=A0A1M7Z0J4_9VIBR|nr:hypothetical protein VQ7734_04162 [Vibrio quintilis]